MPSIGVVGTGVVGERCARLLARTAAVVLCDHRTDVAASVAADLLDAAVVDGPDDLAGCDVAILAHPGDHAPLAERLLREGTSIVSLAATVSRVQALLDLDELARQRGACLMVGAAMSPGLTGLLARWLAGGLYACDELHVAVHGTAGPACAREHHQALGDTAIGWHDDSWIERRGGSGRELCWFPEPVGAYDCYRADISEPVTLHRAFPGASRISARISANRRDRLTSRLPMLTPPHREGGIGALRVEARGADIDGRRVTLIAGIAERAGTASATTAAVFATFIAARSLPAGAIVAGDAALPTLDLLAAVEARGVRLQGFTGVPATVNRSG